MATAASPQIKIVRNAPPPPPPNPGRKPGPGRKHATHTRYPWDQLRVGDAFDVPITSGYWAPFDRFPEFNRLTATVHSRHQRYPERYVVRMMDDYRVRVWRVA